MLLSALVVGGTMCGMSARRLFQAIQLDVDGRPAVAAVTGWSEVSGDRRGSRLEVQASFNVGAERYEVANTHERDGEWLHLPRDVFARTQQTGSVDVSYLPSDPQINRLRTGRSMVEEELRSGSWILGLSVLAFIPAYLVFAFAWNRVLRRVGAALADTPRQTPR